MGFFAAFDDCSKKRDEGKTPLLDEPRELERQRIREENCTAKHVFRTALLSEIAMQSFKVNMKVIL
jgi:hypothetical protein